MGVTRQPAAPADDSPINVQAASNTMDQKQEGDACSINAYRPGRYLVSVDIGPDGIETVNSDADDAHPEKFFEAHPEHR